MHFIFLLSCVFIHNAMQVKSVSLKDTGKTFIYDRYKYNTIINLTVNSTTEQILDFIEESDRLRGYPTRVHVSSNDTIDGEYPVFITATQQKGVSSWELPLVVRTTHGEMTFNDMARTLCPHDAGPNITSVNRPTIQISTANPRNVSVDIKLRRVDDFFLEIDKEVPLKATPNTPKYYYFSFDTNPWNVSKQEAAHELLPRFNYTIPKSVILIIESDDDVCAVVSIQNNSCPVFDNEKDMTYQGYHLTMTSKGGITLTQSMFPVGFYIVFIVKENDEDCTGVSETANIAQWSNMMGGSETEWVQGNSTDGRVKNFRFKLIATISYMEYVVAAIVTLALVSLTALFALLVYVPTCACTETIVIADAPGPSHSLNSEETPIMAESDDNEMRLKLTVADLSKAGPDTLSRRSDRYIWSAVTVAVVYALPVVQLLFTYQQMVFQTGNQDLCYYNFLCAHPFGFLSDFNHVLSNVGYVLLGLVFMAQTRTRQIKAQRNALEGSGLGIPQHWGLFHAMGLALVMEGLLSACYHLCPNKMNFQFDSSFMYVIAVLCMVKLYQNRHPDVNASAHATFMLLAFIMAIGLCGIMSPTVTFWTLFTIAHLVTCFLITLKIYYFGQFQLDRSVFRQVYVGIRTYGRRSVVPNYVARAILLAVANLANWALAGYGLYHHNKDFARHLLAILMGNTILYTMFYIIMKLVHRERILVHTWLYFILAHAAWFTALMFFLDSKTKWSQTPAMSRRHNAVCSALQFYDSHDLWHGISATALFLSFNMLLTIDDALVHTPRHKIPVF